MPDNDSIQPVASRTNLLSPDMDFLKIIRSEVPKDPHATQGEGQPAKIIYYCRECKKPISAQRIPGKLQFKCAECGSSRVAFGSEDSILSYYRLRKEDKNKKQTEL